MLRLMATRRIRPTSVGDELALVLDGETLDALGWTAETEVELRVENDALVIEGMPPDVGPLDEPSRRRTSP